MNEGRAWPLYQRRGGLYPCNSVHALNLPYLEAAQIIHGVGMIVLSACYLFGGLVVAPDLWLDPLGPMVKVVPAIVLAAIVAMMLEAR